MEKEKLDLIAFEIIAHSGDGRTLIHEAFALMRNGEYDKAKEKLDEAQQTINKAHQAQTELLYAYANDESVKIEIIMVHAQDHMMTTMTLREVALEMLYLYEKSNR